MARSPFDGKIYYFIEKCLPFGAAISCLHFQHFSNSVSFILKVKTSGFKLPNYLDDFLFVAMLKSTCNQLVQEFINICNKIQFLVSLEKTIWDTTTLTFLGMLLDSESQTVSVPIEKIQKAVDLVTEILQSRKTTVKKLQKLTGFLNFICRCVLLGRAFTRRMYCHYSPLMLPHHHVRVNTELKSDLRVWLSFLNNPAIYCRHLLTSHKSW